MKSKAKMPPAKMATKAKKSMEYPKPSKKGFVNWLTRQSPNKKFKGADDLYCPLGTYCREVCGIQQGFMGMPYAEWHGGFVETFDNYAVSSKTKRARDDRRVKLHVALKAARETGLIK